MSSNSVCSHSRDKEIEPPLRGRPTLFIVYIDIYHSYDYRPNWTPLCPITITNRELNIPFGLNEIYAIYMNSPLQAV